MLSYSPDLMWGLIVGTIVLLFLAVTIIVIMFIYGKKIRESEKRYELVMTGTNDGIWDWNLETNEMYFSPRWKSILGYCESEITTEDNKKVKKELSDHLDGKIPTFQNEHHLLHKDGTYCCVFWRGLVVRNSSGKTIRFAGSMTDITDRKLLEKQFFQAQKMEAIGRLAAGIAHDFNNLLTGITGYCELLLNSDSTNDSIREDLEEIKIAGEKAISLTRQLMAFSRKQIPKPKIIDSNSVIIDMSKLLRRIIGEDIELVTILDSTLGRIKADPGKIEQVIMNIATNARDAMPLGGKLIFKTFNGNLEANGIHKINKTHLAPYVILSISDTGCGIDSETLSHIFEPFFTTKDQSKGTGLGLSTVYGIVEQYGGDITVSSKLGKGTTFNIIFPRTNDEEIIKVSPINKNKFEFKRSSETILLVEDDETVRNLAGRILRENGFSVLTANNGLEALDICRQHTGLLQLLATDIVLPKLNGYELAKQVKNQFPNVMVLYMSGYTDCNIIKDSEFEKGEVLLQKPFTPEAFLSKVYEVLEIAYK